MSFFNYLESYKDFNFAEFQQQITSFDIKRAIEKDNLTSLDYLTLLSPQAEEHLEEMAQKASKLTRQHFGQVVFLYTPLYLANYCENYCLYCSFNSKSDIKRKLLSPVEVEKEAQSIAATGLKHILILTGESRVKSPVSYIKECVQILKKYFSSISIEVYPLSTEEYQELIKVGVDGLTIYQEVYNPQIYDRLHVTGPKKDYRFRLDAPERGCQAGVRAVNIGALLGLSSWRQEAFFTGLHADYLQDKYMDVEVSASFPRIQPFKGSFEGERIPDKKMVQGMLAFRLFMPRAGITISTRESQEFRDNLLGLGVTRMSAGSTTKVGGHTCEDGEGQFEISDNRDVAEMKKMLLSRGYQPVFKDWHLLEV